MCSLHVVQPFATVREVPMALPIIVIIGSAANVLTFELEGFKRCATSLWQAALCDIATSFITSQKSFCVG